MNEIINMASTNIVNTWQQKDSINRMPGAANILNTALYKYNKRYLRHLEKKIIYTYKYRF